MTTTKTIRVKKPADPFASTINKRLADREQRKAMGEVNTLRNNIGYLSWGARFFRKYIQ